MRAASSPPPQITTRRPFIRKNIGKVFMKRPRTDRLKCKWAADVNALSCIWSSSLAHRVQVLEKTAPLPPVFLIPRARPGSSGQSRYCRGNARGRPEFSVSAQISGRQGGRRGGDSTTASDPTQDRYRRAIVDRRRPVRPSANPTRGGMDPGPQHNSHLNRSSLLRIIWRFPIAAYSRLQVPAIRQAGSSPLGCRLIHRVSTTAG